MSRLLVHIDDGKSKRSRVWNLKEPLVVGHPIAWVFKKTEAGVQIFDLRGSSGKLEKNRYYFISNDEIDKSEFEKSVVSDKFSFKIQNYSGVQPAYLSKIVSNDGVSPVSKSPSLQQFWVYSGIRRSINHSKPVHGAYVAYYKLQPLFILYHQSDKIQIKTVAHGVRMKQKGLPSEILAPGSIHELQLEGLGHVTFRRSLNWWKFQSIPVPVGMGKSNNTSESVSGEDLRWENLVLLLLLLIIAGIAGVTIMAPEKKAAVPIEPQVAKVLPRKAKFKAPGTNDIATTSESSAPPSPNNVASDLPPSGSKGETEKTAAKKTPKLIQASSSEPIAPRPVLTERQKASQSALANTKLLQSLLGSKVLTTSEQAITKPNPANAGSTSVFRGAEGVGQPTQISGAVEVKSGEKVAGIGGAGAGGKGSASLGYGSGDKNSTWVGGTGNSFMNIGGGGSSVAEGLTREEVAAVIQAHKDEIRYCHDSALLKNPLLAGKIALYFVIGPQGNVTTGKEESNNVGESSLGPCILRRLLTWKFPHPRGGVNVSVSFPFFFKTLDKK